MPGGHEGDLALQLIDAGLSRETPCFVVAGASRADEEVVETTLGELPRLEKLPAPALLLIGVIPVKNGPSGTTSQNAGKQRSHH